MNEGLINTKAHLLPTLTSPEWQSWGQVCRPCLSWPAFVLQQLGKAEVKLLMRGRKKKRDTIFDSNSLLKGSNARFVYQWKKAVLL